MKHDDPEDAEELFVQMFARHERDLRALARSMGLGWIAVDDVMQTVSLVMWRKWSEFDPETDFISWARVITRLEVLKFRRKLARDRHVFGVDVMELLAGAAEELEADTSSEDYRAALHQCLQSLPDRSRGLISAAYAGDRTIRDVANEIGQSPTAFYKALNRIREKLRQCVHRRLQAMP